MENYEIIKEDIGQGNFIILLFIFCNREFW